MRYISPISGLGVAAMAAAMMQHIGDMEAVQVVKSEGKTEPERRISIIAPEPAEEPRRHTGKREAARRLRQLAKRSA